MVIFQFAILVYHRICSRPNHNPKEVVWTPQWITQPAISHPTSLAGWSSLVVFFRSKRISPQDGWFPPTKHDQPKSFPWKSMMISMKTPGLEISKFESPWKIHDDEINQSTLTISINLWLNMENPWWFFGCQVWPLTKPKCSVPLQARDWSCETNKNRIYGVTCSILNYNGISVMMCIYIYMYIYIYIHISHGWLMIKYTYVGLIPSSNIWNIPIVRSQWCEHSLLYIPSDSQPWFAGKLLPYSS